MANTEQIIKFIRENRVLFWSLNDEDINNISMSFLVETLLNYGNENNIRELFNLLGIRNVADIFYRQIAKKRVNYHPRTINFFKLYFQKHAQ